MVNDYILGIKFVYFLNPCPVLSNCLAFKGTRELFVVCRVLLASALLLLKVFSISGSRSKNL